MTWRLTHRSDELWTAQHHFVMRDFKDFIKCPETGDLFLPGVELFCWSCVVGLQINEKG